MLLANDATDRVRPIKTTTSACPTCLRKVPATVFERDGKVFLEKRCAEHGQEEALLASDARLYWHSESGKKAAGCGPAGCGLTNHSCTLIFEITEKCNLACPTCFTGSSPHETWHMTLEEFEAKLDRLLAAGKRDADLVQLSGGEPTIHPDLEEMIAACFTRGIRKVYVNTNGVRLAKDIEFARRLGALNDGKDRLQLYLQLDGFRERTHQLIRGARGLGPVKSQAIANALACGLYVLPVMAVTRGVNLDEIGDVVRLVVDHHPRMNTVILQPAFYAGRYENEPTPERLTLAEVATEVERQTDGLFTRADFGPIPCSNPNCFALAVALVRGGKLTPISRYFPRFDTWGEADVAAKIARFADKMPQNLVDVLAEDEMVDQLLDLLAADDDAIDWNDHRSFVMIGIKPFMDAHTYDQDRVDGCCVHVVDREGLPVSLCEYNTLRRPRGLL